MLLGSEYKEHLREAAEDEHKPDNDIADTSEPEEILDHLVVERAKCQTLVEEQHGELHAPNQCRVTTPSSVFEFGAICYAVDVRLRCGLKPFLTDF